MPKYRSYSIAFKRQLVDDYLAGASVHDLSRRYDVGRALIRLWTQKAEAGDFDDEVVTAALLGQYEARIEALERLAGKQALELEFLKRALELASRRSETPSIISGPPASQSRKDAG
jgi:transposase